MSCYTEYAIYCECETQNSKNALLKFINDYSDIDEIKKDISELNINKSFEQFCDNDKEKFIISFEINIYHYDNLVDFLRDLIDKLHEMSFYKQIYYEYAIIGEEIDDISYNYGDKEVILFNRTITINNENL